MSETTSRDLHQQSDSSSFIAKLQCLSSLPALQNFIYSNQNWEAENNNEYLYISSLDKNVYKYDIVNKKKIWTCRLGGRIFSTPVLKEDFIYGGCNDGKIYKIDKNTGEKCGYIQFTERVLNNIIFDAKNERRVFVPTQANEIYCLELE